MTVGGSFASADCRPTSGDLPPSMFYGAGAPTGTAARRDGSWIPPA